MKTTFLTLIIACSLVACAAGGAMDSRAQYGFNPPLPPPETSLIPTVDIAPAVGWKDGEAPTAAKGFRVAAFARGLDHPRNVHVLPNGDVLVAESAAPAASRARGITGWIANFFMSRAGSSVPSADRITLLRDADGDGVAEVRAVLLENIRSPFGMALAQDTLFIGAADVLLSFPYLEGASKISFRERRIIDLPSLPLNYHWTKNIAASPDQRKIYVAVGSNSNIGENGLDIEEGRAAIWEVDIASQKGRLFATGLRNPVGMDWEPATNTLWTVVNERDELGNDLVPDYLTSVRDGGFYGWPYSYFGGHVDERVKPQRPDLVAAAIVPDYALGSHTASLGLVFYRAAAFPERFRGGAFIGQHGSWNRKPPVGYKVVFVPFAGGKPSGMPEDILTGFLDTDGNARGRPVGVAVDSRGALLVADDVGDTVWRVTPGP